MNRSIVRPADHWSSLGQHAHAVQFYTNDGHLLDLLTRFVGTALITGDSAVVIATRAHRDGLGKRLRGRGLDLAVPRAEGRYVTLDAGATLAKFMRDERPDADLFREVVGGVMGRIAAGGGRIAAFGEMVALLWAQGKHESAIRLETMWNDLAREHAFALCCAYPMRGFGNRHAAPFMKICAAHSHVFTVTNDAEGLQTLPTA
ncbi:MAG: MEDS domain-containing protein [Acidobacteria bacterium]|nr:MEDS domain-containing protein [Acidobacteriota bacterium]